MMGEGRKKGEENVAKSSESSDLERATYPIEIPIKMYEFEPTPRKPKSIH
jgi:hypothetical protein